MPSSTRPELRAVWTRSSFRSLRGFPPAGVTLPLISYGGTSLVSSMCLVGIMQGVSACNRARMKEAREEALYEGEGAL